MRSKRLFAAVAVLATLSVVGAACAAPAADDKGSSNKKTSLNVGWNQPWYSYNDATSNGNAVANFNNKYLLNSQFWFMDPQGEYKEDTSFGKIEKISDDPLTIKYTVADDVNWSDGTPVDAADLLFAWASQSGNFNTVDASKVKTDEATGQPKAPKGEVYFDSSSIGFSLIKETPVIGDGGKSLTMKYTKPFSDWKYDMFIYTPAHVTAQKALGISDPKEANDALIKAIQDKDNAALEKVASFWNTGYDYTKMPADKSITISNGPYVMKDLKENEYMTLEKNPDYKGDHEASVDTLTVRWNEDGLAQVQALENGELDMFSPQVTTDVVKAAEKIKNVEIFKGVEGSFEHLDLVQNNKGPFDPATYGGDATKALQVRQAFLHALPRQEVVDKLIKPINPDAEVRNSFTRTPGTPGYDEVVAQNGSSDYSEVDPNQSKSLLKQAGITKPINVRVLYAKGNPRRENEFQLFKPALANAGFNLIDKGDPEWSAKLGDGTYDAVYYAWAPTSGAVAADREIYASNGQSNSVGYASKKVDTLFDQLVVTPDLNDQVKIQTDIEKNLFADAEGITIFQFPAVTVAKKDRVSGIEPGVLAPTMFYGFWNWKAK